MRKVTYGFQCQAHHSLSSIDHSTTYLRAIGKWEEFLTHGIRADTFTQTVDAGGEEGGEGARFD